MVSFPFSQTIQIDSKQTKDKPDGGKQSNKDIQQAQTRLEPVFLANVVLFLTDCTTLSEFIRVSRKCRKTLHFLRKNPNISFVKNDFCLSLFELHRTLDLFPNIETLVVSHFTFLGRNAPFLPSSIKRIVLTERITKEQVKRLAVLPCADRIAEVSIEWESEETLDISSLVSLERCSLSCSSSVPQIVFPPQRLSLFVADIFNVHESSISTLQRLCNAPAERVVVRLPLESDPQDPSLADLFSENPAVMFRFPFISGIEEVFKNVICETRWFFFNRIPPPTQEEMDAHFAAHLPEEITVDSNLSPPPHLDLSAFTSLHSVASFGVHVDFPPGVTRLEGAPPTFPSSLCELFLHNQNNLTALPKLDHLTAMTFLSNQHRFECVPEHLPCIKELAIQDIQDIPSLGAFTTLTWLNLVRCSFCPNPSLPASLCFLALEGTAPPCSSLSTLTNLTRLDIDQSNETTLQHLDLSHCTKLVSLWSLSPAVFLLPDSLLNIWVEVHSDLDLSHFASLVCLFLEKKAEATVTLPLRVEQLCLKGFDAAPAGLKKCSVDFLELEDCTIPESCLPSVSTQTLVI